MIQYHGYHGTWKKCLPRSPDGSTVTSQDPVRPSSQCNSPFQWEWSCNTTLTSVLCSTLDWGSLVQAGRHPCIQTMLILSIRNIKPVDLSCGNSKLTDEKLSPAALSLNPTFSLESIFFCNLVASLCTKFSRVHGILPPYAPLLFLVATVSFHNSHPQILTATPVQSGGLPVTYSGLSAW